MRSAVKPGPRVRVMGAALLAASAVLTAGCGLVGTPGAEAGKDAVGTPHRKLLEATATSSTAPYAYTYVLTGDPADAVVSTGSVDAAGKVHELEVIGRIKESHATVRMAYRIVDQKVWTKVRFEGGDELDFPELPQKWMLVDPSKTKENSVPSGFSERYVDPAQLNTLFTTATDVTEGAGGRFSGTFDLDVQPVVYPVTPAIRTALGEKARALPFTATVTDGHVSHYMLSVPPTSASKALTFTVTYTGFGTVTPVTAPSAAETAETPDALYEALAGLF